MQTEMIRAPKPAQRPIGWPGHSGKQVMVVYSLPADRPVQLTVSCLAAAAALAVAGTSVNYRFPVIDLEKVGSPSPAAAVTREEEAQLSIPSMLQSIRKRTALTWDQLAALFSVSRRAVHLWASGNTVIPQNRLKVRSLLNEVLALGDLEPFIVRARLLERHDKGARVDNRGRSEPILVADQSSLMADNPVRRTPTTRIRHG